MAKKNLANNKVILAMGVGIAAMLAMPMYANAEEGIEPQQEPVIPTESVDETVSGEDFNDDGDTLDRLDVTRDEEALASVDQSTIQEGSEGLENPVKVAEITITDNLGDNLTKEEVDSIIEDLGDKYAPEDSTVSENN